MVYDAKMDEGISWRVFRVRLAHETGWPLEYIDALGLQDAGDFMGYWAGKAKGEDRLSRKTKKAGKG